MSDELKAEVFNRWEKYAVRGARDECWQWTGPKDQDGYGRFRFQGKTYRAHRVALQAVVLPPTDKHFACHTCDNPSCCNPTHLWWGTNAENLRDRDAKGRQKPPAKLTEDQVRQIRHLRSEGRSQRELAAQFAIDPTNVNHIVHRRSWKHVL